MSQAYALVESFSLAYRRDPTVENHIYNIYYTQYHIHRKHIKRNRPPKFKSDLAYQLLFAYFLVPGSDSVKFCDGNRV